MSPDPDSPHIPREVTPIHVFEIYADGQHMGAISLIGSVQSGISAARLHRNIVLENNTITDVPGLAILVGSSDGVAIRNNTLIRSNQLAFDQLHTGANIDAVAKGSIMVTRASNVTITGNRQIVTPDMFDKGIYVDSRNTSNIAISGNTEGPPPQ